MHLGDMVLLSWIDSNSVDERGELAEASETDEHEDVFVNFISDYTSMFGREWLLRSYVLLNS